MEKEGSGYDKIYEVLLNNAKPLPKIFEGEDRVCITINNRIVDKDVLKWMDSVNKEFQLKQKELITLGLIAQHNGLSATNLGALLDLNDEKLSQWLGRLLEFKLVEKKGKTKGVTYFVNPKLLAMHQFMGKTNLKLIETYRLKALIIEDLTKYPKSLFGDLHVRIGLEIPKRSIRTLLKNLEIEGYILKEGIKRYTFYTIDANSDKKKLSQ